MNKPKYIEAERFVECFGNWYTEEGTENGFIGTIKDLVKQTPAADVQEVVRCRECKHRYGYKCDYDDRPVGSGDYCSRGERMDEVSE